VSGDVTQGVQSCQESRVVIVVCLVITVVASLTGGWYAACGDPNSENRIQSNRSSSFCHTAQQWNADLIRGAHSLQERLEAKAQELQQVAQNLTKLSNSSWLASANNVSWPNISWEPSLSGWKTTGLDFNVTNMGWSGVEDWAKNLTDQAQDAVEQVEHRWSAFSNGLEDQTGNATESIQSTHEQAQNASKLLTAQAEELRKKAKALDSEPAEEPGLFPGWNQWGAFNYWSGDNSEK